MKNFIFLILFYTFSTFANGSRPPQNPPQAPDNDRSVFKVNPDTLRLQLMDENMDIIHAAHRVATAKSQLNLARSNLFPSINLGTVLLSAGQPTFMLSSIEVLAPFLLPSKWFELRKAKFQIKADQSAYHVIQLSVYANVWSLYQTLLNDQKLLNQLLIDAEDWRLIEEKTAERFEWGLVTQQEMILAKSQRALAFLRAEKVKGLLVEEKAQLKNALGLGIGRSLFIEESSIPTQTEENWSTEKLRDASLEKSPEIAQLYFLEQAGITDRWSRIFGFIVGASASQSASGSGSVGTAFDGFTGRGVANFGLAQFPVISLASRNIESIQLRRKELGREIGKLSEVLLGHFPILHSRLALANEAETALRENFDRILENYQLGLGATLNDVLRARIGIQEATVERIRATTDLNLGRISLMRLLRKAEFSKVDGCHYPVISERQRGAKTPDGRLKICTKIQPES